MKRFIVEREGLTPTAFDTEDEAMTLVKAFGPGTAFLIEVTEARVTAFNRDFDGLTAHNLQTRHW